MVDECSICVDKFNGSYRKEVTCLYCGYSACQKCIERYLIEGTIIPRCMECKTEWNMEFLRASLSQSFMNKEFKEHQKNSILVQAEAEIGQYQDLAAHQTRIDNAHKVLRDASSHLKEAQRAVYDAKRALYDILYEEQSRPAQVIRADFFLACPRTDCRGRVSSGYKCGLCEHFFCSQCHWDKGLEKDVEHECAQDDMDTVRMLKENTRNCPKCRMGIFKTEGCDQMWCVSCQTAFSWRSGNILNGPIHNPEYYDFQRRQRAGGIIPRQPGDVICGGMPHVYLVRNRLGGVELSLSEEILHIHRNILHIENITMPSLHRKYNQRPELFQTHGISYLRGLIDRMSLRDRLYKATRQEEKYRRYYQILEMLTTNIQEIFRQFVAEAIDAPTTKRGCDELFSHANDALDKMRKQFKMTIPIFSSDMSTTRL
jgi:hypothetical protein